MAKSGNYMLKRARGHEDKAGGMKTPQSKSLIKTATQEAMSYSPYHKGNSKK